MKKLFNLRNIFLIAAAMTLISCTSKPSVHLPNIINPTYSSYMIHDERGYDVSFQISDDSVEPVGIILNHIQQKIYPEQKNGLHYKVNVIAQSRKISGFRAEGSKRPDGIIFKVGDTYYVKTVDFKRK